jgi:hypothetical protein
VLDFLISPGFFKKNAYGLIELPKTSLKEIRG